MGHRAASEGHRVLIVAPYGRDADNMVRLLGAQGYDAVACADLDAVAEALDDHVGVVLLTQEAMRGGAERLTRALQDQPRWSDVPFILLTSRSRPGRGKADDFGGALLRFTSNAIVLERPIGMDSLISATASAMRARQRQFEMRDRIEDLEEGRRAVAASARELGLVADAMPVLVGFIDSGLHYRFANSAYADWFYMQPSEVVGRPVQELLTAEGWAAREPAMRRALAGETVRLELPWPHRDGRRREADIRYIPRRGADGAVDGFYAFVLDITDRKTTEEELASSVAERTSELEAEMARRTLAETALRQSQKMEAVGQLTGGIAHDFNNMLTGVIGAMDIIKRRLAAGRTDDLDRFVDAAATSAQRAAGLTARLLAFSRRQSLDAKPVDVNELLVSLEELLRRSVRENVNLRIVPGDDVGFATVDANQLESAILNLAINARDAMPDGGQLTVESRVVDLDETYAATHPDIGPGRYVVVSVSDTGVGMSPQVLEKVFDPFFTTKPVGQGTGLGLSMVYGFARQSGGQVRVHSEPGIGTTVSIYLGASDVDAHAVSAETRAAPVEGDGQSVLLVEDDPSVRLLVREVLEELSYTTIEAQEANGAITVLASDRHIDLMVSDVGLPGMNGRQLAEVARSHRPDLPILFVTGYAENAAMRAGFLGTNMGMITKPFAIEELSAKIQEMLA